MKINYPLCGQLGPKNNGEKTVVLEKCPFKDGLESLVFLLKLLQDV